MKATMRVYRRSLDDQMSRIVSVSPVEAKKMLTKWWITHFKSTYFAHIHTSHAHRQGGIDYHHHVNYFAKWNGRLSIRQVGIVGHGQ